MTALAEAGTDGRVEAATAALPDPAERGRTRIADRVVERIAARAVAEVDNATGVARHVLGVRLGSAGDHQPARVNADVDGGVVLVRASMAVRWPAPIRAVTQQVRSHVTDRVQQMTGLRVAEVDIDVTTLAVDDGGSNGGDRGRRVI